jgi:exodeoxyribonuclease VII small subunit
MKFEEQVSQLEEIAKKLESDDISLEESVKLYEEGVAVAKRCISILNENKAKIKDLSAQLNALTADETDGL